MKLLLTLPLLLLFSACFWSHDEYLDTPTSGKYKPVYNRLEREEKYRSITTTFLSTNRTKGFTCLTTAILSYRWQKGF